MLDREKERGEAVKQKTQELTNEEMQVQKRKVDSLYKNWDDSEAA